jgi:NADPH2:quinone reductase
MGLLVNWPTALAALRPLGRIAAGQTVLIHAAAGGTGQAAVKMAKHYGAIVIATASPGKHETVRVLGADHVLDSRAADLAAEVLRLTGGTVTDQGIRQIRSFADPSLVALFESWLDPSSPGRPRSRGSRRE